MEKKQEWCFRLDQELRYSDNSFFVTFTYRDDELIFADDEPSLYKRHLQLYFKRLRKFVAPGRIKYFAVGEYGDKGARPHYHALIFYRGDYDWFRLKIKIAEFWQHGICQVLPVDGAQGYVTKYVLKHDKREFKVKPFSLISHGLGIDYLSDQMIDYHRQNLISYGIKPGGFKVSLPRYYKDKIFSTAQKLLMKSRSDLIRRDLECKQLENIDLQMSFGINPFRERVKKYQNDLYQSMKLYQLKKKL